MLVGIQIGPRQLELPPNMALSDGRNLLHLCFLMAEHSETSWGMRSHLLMQFLNGAVARAYRVNRSVLGELPFGNEPASPDQA